MSASLCKYCGSDLCRGECWTPRHDLIKSLEHPIAEKLAELLREILEPGVFGEPFLTNPDRVVANAIRDLCELRGYGNVMATAAALWSEKDPSGAISLAACNGVRKPVLKKIRDALAEYEKGKKP